MSIPSEKSKDNIKAVLIDLSFLPLIKPTINGILARWQGLKMMLSTPHTKAPAKATAEFDLIKPERKVKR
jgi:hypothetical protein